MPTQIKWPDGKIETVEDHLALLWQRQGRAEILPAVAPPEGEITKEVPRPLFHRSVKKPVESKSITTDSFGGKN